MPFGTPSRSFLVGIAGGTGAGKTYVTRLLAERYAEAGVCVLDEDSYYLDRSGCTPEERLHLNYDLPSSLDHELLREHLQQLVSGKNVEKPIYSFATHTREPGGVEVASAPIVVLEGLFALWDERLRSLMDLRIYVDADPDLRFIRRLRRDIEERGRSAASVVEQYLATVRPMHEQHVAPTRAHADIVLEEGRPLTAVYRVLDDWLRRRSLGHSA